MSNTHTQQNTEHLEKLVSIVKGLKKALEEYKDYFVVSKDESIHSVLTELYKKINANPEEFKKATSSTTDKVLNIVDNYWEQIKNNAKIFKNHYADMSKVKVSRDLRKNFLSEHQKFFSMGKHAENAQKALNNTKQIVDTKHQYSKVQTQQLLQSDNRSQLQNNIAPPNESQRLVTLPLISNAKEITTSNIKR